MLRRFPRDVTLLMIEHDMAVALDLAERVRPRAPSGTAAGARERRGDPAERATSCRACRSACPGSERQPLPVEPRCLELTPDHRHVLFRQVLWPVPRDRDLHTAAAKLPVRRLFPGYL